jgi:hypothetical protein
MPAGRERPDGNDETVLEGTKEDSCFPNGFWHPYGRGANMPPTRVVCLAPEAVAQVTLKLPDADAIAAAQVSPQAASFQKSLLVCNAAHLAVSSWPQAECIVGNKRFT